MGVYKYPVNKQLIDGLPKIPYRNGIGAYEGVVLHYTDNEQDTAASEAAYESRTWQSAFVHFFIDPKQIIQVADTDYICWGCGQYGNQRFVQIEMCHADTIDEFNQIFDMACEKAAELLAARKLGVSPAKSDGSGTLWSHADVSKYLGGTNHTDPIAWLQRWGKTWQDVIDRVSVYYNGLVNETQPQPSTTTPTPSKSATIKTPIFGKATATVDQMRAYLKSKNPNAPDYAQLYLDIGAKYGIAGDLAFCQSIKETGAWKFGGQVKLEQNNFAGIGALNGGAAGASFSTPAEGIEAQIQHLYGYATTNPLPTGVNCIDPRFDILTKAGKRGTAPYWEDLDGKWAVPGDGYGESIVAMWKEMCAIKVEPPKTEQELAIQWVRDNKLMSGYPDGTFGENDPLTRGQFALVLYRFSKLINQNK
jgi:N-acetylmuramoyl-L-alanine amidase CwlA